MDDAGMQSAASSLDSVIKFLEKKSWSDILIYVCIILVIILLYAGLCLGMMKLNKKVFKMLRIKRGNSISLQFLEKAITLVLIIVLIVIPLGGETFSRSLLGSTTVVAAVVGLAANDVIRDMFAGLQISIYKPFDVGTRLMLDTGETGIVEKLTLRHVVLRQIDTTRIIVPNSKANTAIIVNYSYEDHVPRAMSLTFSISYDSDLELAKEVIRRVICSNPLTLNKDEFSENNPNSRSVYFLELAQSALVLGATIYYSHDLRSEVVKDEINTCVYMALRKAGIEIPYSYMNVVVTNNDKSNPTA